MSTNRTFDDLVRECSERFANCTAYCMRDPQIGRLPKIGDKVQMGYFSDNDWRNYVYGRVEDVRRIKTYPNYSTGISKVVYQLQLALEAFGKQDECWMILDPSNADRQYNLKIC